MRLSVASLVLFAFLACGDDVMVDGGTVNHATVRDQSGAVFNWDCDADGGCVVSRMGDRPPLPDCPDPDAPPDYKYAAGSFFEVIGVCVLGQDGADWRKGVKSALITTVLFFLVISILVFLFAKPLMLIFVRPHETEILNLGISYQNLGDTVNAKRYLENAFT